MIYCFDFQTGIVQMKQITFSEDVEEFLEAFIVALGEFALDESSYAGSTQFPLILAQFFIQPLFKFILVCLEIVGLVLPVGVDVVGIVLNKFFDVVLILFVAFLSLRVHVADDVA